MIASTEVTLWPISSSEAIHSDSTSCTNVHSLSTGTGVTTAVSVTHYRITEDMDVESEEWVQHALFDFERKRCLSKVISIQCENAIPKGNNYGSDMYRLKLKAALYSGDVVTKSFIYKKLPETETRRAFFKETRAYAKEAKMYTEILPEMERIRQKKEFGVEPLSPICYGVQRGHTGYLLEDLSAIGYKMANRRKGVDVHEAEVVMKKLAQFHALSIILIERGDICIGEFSDNVYIDQKKTLEPTIISQLTEVANAIEREWQGEWLSYAEKLRNYSKDLMPKFLDELIPNEKNINALVHGDCWTTNMLFKYDNEGQAKNNRFIDFQFSHHNNVGVDLQYFFFTSLSREALQKVEELLHLYHDKLQFSLRLYGYSGEIPTLEQVLESYQAAKIYGFTLGVAFRPLMMQPEKSVPDDLEEWTKKILNEGSMQVPVDLECGIREVLIYGSNSGIL